jgi:hypothetical protein
MASNASWIHGVGGVLQTSSWSAYYEGMYVTVRPSPGNLFGWVHFPVPTTVLSGGQPVAVLSGSIRFQTGPQATITSIHVWCPDTKILSLDGLSLKGAPQDYTFGIPSSPKLPYGTAVCVGVTFGNTGQDAWVRIMGAGLNTRIVP